MDENDLFLDYVNNNNDMSLKILIKKINKWLPNFIFRIVGDKEKTKDIVQDTWFKIIETKNRFDPMKGTINNRIYKIAKNYALKELEKIRKNSNESDSISFFIINSKNPDPLFLMEEEEKIRILNKALSKLKSKCQEIINLYYFDDFSYDQLKEVLDISMNTVKMRLLHCKKYLGLEIRRLQ